MGILTLPGAELKLISYRAEAGAFVGTPLGWIEHSAETNGPLFNYFNGLKSPGRKFSTGWIAKNGSSQQYTEIHMKSWGNGPVGNPLYWSFEFEGFKNEPLTPEQIHVAALWHNFLNVANYLANKTGEKGVGVHYMVANTACPSPTRAAQRTLIINTAKDLQLGHGDVIPIHPKPPVVRPPVVVPPNSFNPPFGLGNFPLPKGHCFGPRTGPVWQHSGYANGNDKAGMYVWQRGMRQRGWNITVDGYYGDQTAKIAKQFQAEKGLTVDGLIGLVSWNRTKIRP